MTGEPTLYTPGEEGDVPGSVSARLNALVLERLLPACPSLLDDEDPIPLYTLKLAVALLEANPALVITFPCPPFVLCFFQRISLCPHLPPQRRTACLLPYERCCQPQS